MSGKPWCRYMLHKKITRNVVLREHNICMLAVPLLRYYLNKLKTKCFPSGSRVSWWTGKTQYCRSQRGALPIRRKRLLCELSCPFLLLPSASLWNHNWKIAKCSGLLHLHSSSSSSFFWVVFSSLPLLFLYSSYLNFSEIYVAAFQDQWGGSGRCHR